MVEKNAPFVLGVSDAIDRTEDVLSMVNARYADEIALAKKASVKKG